MKEILIIGGGASGIAAALSAAEAAPHAKITILEGLDRVGKKILATGNGRCNLSNESISPDCYHTERPDRLERFLTRMPTETAVEFFRRQGLLCASDEAGRLYPYCRQASMVLDVLRLALERSGVRIECGCRVAEISCKNGRFTVKSEAGGSYRGDAVILTTGGKAAPSQGVTGVGYTLAKRFGHHCTALYPALVPLRSSHSALKGLKGIRVQCRAALLDGDREAACEQGELQFADYGLSGIPAMQLSCYLGKLRGNGRRAVSIDFFPELSAEELHTILAQRAASYGTETLETLFLGLIHKRVLYAVMKDIGIGPLSRTGSELKAKEIDRLTTALKGWLLSVEGTLAWEQAQVTGGGIALDEISDTFESLRQPGLYLAGELLDVTGTCGGYNLHWAWCSGMAAGRAAAMEEKQ